MPEFSIVTIVKGRRKQLRNLLESIEMSTIRPVDIQVVCMDDSTDIPDFSNLNIEIQSLGNSTELPLAAARNAGIISAKMENIIFIDVDCIVSPTLFEGMLRALENNNIIAAYPLYLPILPDSGNFAELLCDAVAHPSRENISANEIVPHLQFWSLIFAVKKATFNKIGGFDESFTGYGAEDTDFAMSFNRAGVGQIFVEDFVLHQYHEKFDPPLNHFRSIIENALRYRQKWNELPMQRWLRSFEKVGLIKIERNDNITIISEPTVEQICDVRSKNPY